MNSQPSTIRRTLLGAALSLAALAVGPVHAQAAFPSKNVRIVVPFAAGGVGDLTARIVAQKLAELLGQSVVIENRPGAGGVVAADTVARAEPDGHTMFLMSNGTAVTAGLFKSLPFDTVKDFTPVSTLGYFDIAVVVPATSPHKTLGELVAFGKANPGKLNVGSINIGSTQNLAAELFKSTAGIDAQVVPFNGTPALIGAIRGQQVDVAVEILAPMLTQIQGGAVRALAVTGEKRSIVLPDVPTALEAGVKDFVASSWNALAVPSKTPRPVVDRLQRDIATTLADPGVREKLRGLNIDARSSTPEQTAALLASDIRRWSGVIERAGIPKQ
ncbi:tripartite tricarboxylate transporter receptor family protein [Hydrogenophaga sp. RAC07]|uniref:Bug family tripartite tricarboxylate transporter substrate binding protein n=1 Tax=Hydrogenophaga sp. RAC07 TaxID=1842537 RepID=UPI00083CC955|nr:tripartite tricarboxylate transporter substrate binding protein [Hydrogenophaga sp. RAC07]AOF87108.1 tripartite tricarboxylate transporter receptor family protein [Hydrogenophaga sp. RAC07]